MWGTHWSINLEKRGIPCVFVVDKPFTADAQITCEKEGMPGLRRVVIPHPCKDVNDAELAEIVPRLLSALTEPLTPEELSPPQVTVEKPPRIIFEGNLEEVNRIFTYNGWTDGLPIIPPTEAVVAHMLTGTSHSPDEIVTESMLPESLIVTVEKVAVVGTMAGCEPAYMPVLLSLVEAFAHDFFSSSVRSTTSFAFAAIVNGPIAKTIGMNAGINAMGSGSGNKANATIGRFLRLAMICLGGSRSGVSDLSSQGNPSKYSFAFAENEDKSPWEPFHVSAGFNPDQSVVSILSGGWNHSSPFGHVDLERMADAIASYELPNGALIIMDPLSARQVSHQGFSKQAAEEYIWTHATKTAAEFRDDFFYPMFIEPVLRGKPWYGLKDYWPVEYIDLPDDAIVQVFPKKDVRIVVVGGETNPFTQAWHLARPSSVVVDKWM